ncbi:hypothetical protein F5888DRAFT_1856170 [Russula emetica]|nr:hypothetical protein F5888DRAFT_1856170 [Russula emetica]
MTRGWSFPASPLPPTCPSPPLRLFARSFVNPRFLVGMQKFALIFLAASTALLGLVAPVEGVALVDRETNADRFARGLPPLPPRAPSQPEVAKRARPSKRDPTPTIEERGHPSKRAFTPALELRSKPSKRADSPAIEKRSRPSKRADITVERRSRPSKRAPKPSKRADTPTVEKRSRPSKRADTPTVERRSRPSKRADTPTVEKRSRPSKRAETPTIEKRTRPSKRADTVAVEKRAKPSKRATPATVEKRTKPSKRATPATVEKRTKPSKRAEAEDFPAQHWQLTSGRLEVRWANNDSIAGYVANNPTGGSFGLNDAMCPGQDNLYVEFFDSNIMVMNPEFPPPYFVGGGDAASSVHDCSNKIRFGSVELGSSSAVWNLDPMSGALNATLVNQDGSEDKPSLVFDPAHNVLSFTHDVNRNPMAEHPVYIYLSD